MKQALKNNQRFWRDAALPFVEAQRVRDGRDICYGKHSHDTFSIGAITGGASVCWNRGQSHDVQTGSVVVVNPEDVHACNPLDGVPWSYQMIYLDCDWLRDLQCEIGADASGNLAMFAEIVARDAALYRELTAMGDVLFDDDIDALGKETAMVAFFTGLHDRLDCKGGLRGIDAGDNQKMRRAADFIRNHCREVVSLSDICAAAEVSPGYLVRAFKKTFGMTPHAWLINCRIQHARHALRRGEKIVDVALETGFADQAHFQRMFKRLMATTPRRYAMAQAA